jgi:uncharacterized protein YegJ (DUF2314 family)
VFPEHDEAMKTAIADALSSIDLFWSKFATPEPDVGPYQVKAGLTTPSGATEHIWMDVVAREGAKIRAVLANDPVNLPDVRGGDEVLVDADRICDWGYWKNDRLYGGFTMRAMLPHLTPREQAQGLAALSPQPFETDIH